MANKLPWLIRAIALILLIGYNLALLTGLIVVRPWWLVDILLIAFYVLGALDAASESTEQIGG